MKTWLEFPKLEIKHFVMTWYYLVDLRSFCLQSGRLRNGLVWRAVRP